MLVSQYNLYGKRDEKNACSPLLRHVRLANIELQRGVAQSGSALRSGRRGRRFESSHPDLWSACGS